MTLARVVAVETLDHLAADDPTAMRSRRDLRRVHLAMGTRSIVLRALRDMTALRRETGLLRVLELGAGDGSLLLGVARASAHSLPPVALTLLDRQALVGSATLAHYAEVGWTAASRVVDVLDWAHDPAESRLHWDVIVANLFMHHFEGAPLAALLHAIAARTERFFACEPARSRLALAGSHLVGALGANAVTREDAVLSVHAGFRADELSRAWPAQGGEWMLREYPAGLFSHCFRAERVEAI